MTLFVNHALAARLDAVEAAQLEGLARMVAQRLPQRGAAFASIAGGRAAFLSRGISTSRAAGLGMRGPVGVAEVEALVDFYHSRGDDARVLVSPFADASLFEHLGARGFRLDGLDTILARRLDRDERPPAAGPRSSGPGGAPTVRRAALEDAAAWVHTSLAGFAPPGKAPDLDRAPVFEAAFHDPASVYLTATIAGVVAGGAGVYLQGSTAHFFAASTLPAFRGRGVQGSLVAARLEVAREAGCDLVFTGTAPGSASQRNFERAGFVPVYSQALLIKRFG